MVGSLCGAVYGGEVFTGRDAMQRSFVVALAATVLTVPLASPAADTASAKPASRIAQDPYATT
jgi:hypothetical protein